MSGTRTLDRLSSWAPWFTGQLTGTADRPAGSADQLSGPYSVRGHTSLGLDALSNLLSWLNQCGRSFSDCALLSAMQRSLLFLPSSNNVRACLACFFFPCISIDCFPIPKDRRLAQQTKLLKERNASLLRAVATVKQNPSSSTVFVSGATEECVLQTLFTPSALLNSRVRPTATPSGRHISLLSSRKFLLCATNWLPCTRLRDRMRSAFWP